ncbi:hypothetical protein OH76DRAFT_1552775 [Lentinus brumalis]|uniref:BHLH domain-containing protein n=1 Tax=Lentinus brumalis TaxID=2498619 RepID=A0A371DQM7_9APHY|nr:hypothetical protein OH76DRAFT_1552775 [Polyporus brumalis]
MSTPPPSESSSSSSTNSPSPSTPHAELKADPSETLEFLLQTMAAHAHGQAQHEPSFDEASQPDWSQLSAWAAQQQDQKLDLGADFNFSFPMDLDFDPNMAVDPSALQFTTIFDQSAFALPPNETPYILNNEMVPNQHHMLFPTAEDFVMSSHIEPGTGRRLSVTSSSSSSGASLSPVMEPASAVPGSPPSHVNLSDPASELAHRVRQMAGVTLAVPVSAQVQQLAAAGGQAKLPIPRLKQSPTPVPAPKRSAKLSPPPSDSGSPPASSSSSSAASPPAEQAQFPAEAPQPPPTQTVIGRPKTSHTTIERRYRTNLNARITGLKQSVPALRVLETKAGVPSPWNDVVDARGFVDGVKVARKMSKANILGKATEYIRVLKKRESRLRREQDGLKTLIAGLVGGPALLKEWEREWRERFGGDEKDEIEDDDAAGGSDDEEGDGDDSEGEDDEGRARKRAKVAKAAKKEKPYRPPPPPPIPGVPGAVPEKRKRGRPRKVPLPPVSTDVSANVTPAPTNAPPNYPTDQPLQDAFMEVKTEHGTQPQQQQYLLAVFAFFSVFNSPLTSSYRSHASAPAQPHHGTVLISHSPTQTQVPVPSSAGYGLHEVVQAAHLLVSTLVFFYVIVPWLSGTLRNSGIISKVASLFARSSCDGPSSSTSSSMIKRNEHVRTALTHALSPAARGSVDEPAQLRASLGVSTGILGLLQSVIKAARRDRGIEINQLEQRAWVRLGELIAFDGTVGNTTRLQTFWCMSWHISTFAASTMDLSTLALIIRPVSNAKASELWERARRREYLRAHEKIVLNNMSVEGAADWLAKWRKWHDTERKGRCTACEKRTPLGVLAAILIRERLRKHAASLFVRTVVRAENASRRAYACEDDCDEPSYAYDADKDLKEEQERKETVEAGKSIGGRTAELAMLLDRIWDTGFCSQEDLLPTRPRHAHCDSHGRSPDVDVDCEDDQDLASQDEAEIRALLTATLIYRRIFPSTIPACAPSSAGGAPAFILSPPPSPSRKNAQLHMALRTALGSPAFDCGADDGRLEDPELGAALEDARDRVVDMLVDFERACRRGGGRSFD